MTDERTGGWSYWTFIIKNMSVMNLTDTLNALGAEGWELVSLTSTVKTWINVTGNDLVAILKKPGAGHKPSRELRITLEGADPEQVW